MDILQYTVNNTPQGWNDCFNYCIDEFRHSSEKLKQESLHNIVFPLYNEIFTIFYILQPQQIKVVILGQDPYQGIIKGSESYNNGIGIPIGNGIAFSCRKQASIQPALRNIFKEVKDNYPETNIQSGDLTPWVQQGVFLLNMCLTVNKDKSGSHKDMWDNFINKVILYLCHINPNIIFVLWGNKAKTLQLPPNIITIVGGHPSPLNRLRNFAGGKYFIRINERLKQIGVSEIQWST